MLTQISIFAFDFYDWDLSEKISEILPMVNVRR
jgi:hypothetical protein